MLAIAKRFGYDGIEPRLDSKHAHGIEVATSPARRQQIKDRINASGIKLACLAASLSYADPERPRPWSCRRRRIDWPATSAPGHPRVRRAFPDQIDREAATAHVADALLKVAAHAADRGVTLCLETHDAWCNPEHVAAIMERVNHPAIAVNWDIMHPVRRGNATMDSAFQALKNWIRHLHIHDGPKEASGLLPIGEGDIDHKRALELLKTIDYQGFISGEWINWEDYNVHLPREIATMRRYEAEIA